MSTPYGEYVKKTAYWMRVCFFKKDGLLETMQLRCAKEAPRIKNVIA